MKCVFSVKINRAARKSADPSSFCPGRQLRHWKRGRHFEFPIAILTYAGRIIESFPRETNDRHVTIPASTRVIDGGAPLAAGSMRGELKDRAWPRLLRGGRPRRRCGSQTVGPTGGGGDIEMRESFGFPREP
jgi:uncharacterized SAM-binding protein YcdF (DUF218 family)